MPPVFRYQKGVWARKYQAAMSWAAQPYSLPVLQNRKPGSIPGLEPQEIDDLDAKLRAEFETTKRGNKQLAALRRKLEKEVVPPEIADRIVEAMNNIEPIHFEMEKSYVQQQQEIDRLSAIKQDLDGELKATILELDKHKTMLKSTISEVVGIKGGEKALLAKLAECEDKFVAVVQKEAVKAAHYQEQIKRRKQEHDQEIIELNKKLENCKARDAQWQSKATRNSQRLKEADEKLKDATRAVENLQQEAHEQQTRSAKTISQLKEEITKKDEIIGSYSDDRSALSTELSEQYHNHVKVLKEEQEQQLTSATERANNAETKARLVERAAYEHEKSANEASDAKRSVEKQLSNEATRADSLQNQLDKLKAELTDARKAHSDLKGRYEKIEKGNSSLTSQLKSAQDTIQANQSDALNVDERLKILQDQLSAVELDNRKIRDESVANETKLRHASRELELAQIRHDNVLDEEAKAKDRQKRHFDEDISHLITQKGDLQSELREVKDEVKQLRQHSTQDFERLRAVRLELDAQASQINSLNLFDDFMNIAKPVANLLGQPVPLEETNERNIRALSETTVALVKLLLAKHGETAAELEHLDAKAIKRISQLHGKISKYKEALATTSEELKFSYQRFDRLDGELQRTEWLVQHILR